MTTYFSYPSIEVQKELKCIAETLVTCGKGILAADESVCTMGKRLQEIGVQNDDDIRRQWRQTLFSTDRQYANYISGVILFHETLCQKDENGRPLTEYLKERCIIPGVKVDTGLVTLYNSEDEVTTQGLDNLGARLAQYKAEGVEFARWRSVFKVGKNTPSYHAIITNSTMIARFASICQSQRICPIIEPEVIPDGDHDIERCQKVTETVLSFVYKALNDHHVYIEGTLLKPNMVTSGLANMNREDSGAIAAATLTALRRVVPPAVPGIVFSSGGQTEEEATVNLNAINQCDGVKPWRLTFAYGRALQASALRVWAGKRENVKPAQDEFLKRAKANGEASQGIYQGQSGSCASGYSASTTRGGSQVPQVKASQFTAQQHKYGDRKAFPSRGGGGPSMFSGETDCCGGGRAPRRSSGNMNIPKQPLYSPRGFNSPKSPRFGNNMSQGQRFNASRTSGRFMHPMNEPDPVQYPENTGPDGSRYGSSNKDCSRYLANSSNADQDMSMVPKTMDQASETTAGQSTN
ncbi:fructose-bisphosphate aldolase-like isoform X2 [Planococcus citri]|uniref:fructose-bisphosphate aldolase-like isoform X2 n=1 Tax=Planococcus citri TaxID=170843 RepID=UPI0031F9A4F9